LKTKPVECGRSFTIGTWLDHLQEALNVERLAPGRVVRIVNEKGIVLARSDDGVSSVGGDLSEVDSIARHLAAEQISEVVRWPDGVDRITGSSTAHEAPWLVSVGLPTDIVFATTASRLVWSALFIAGTLMTAFAIAWTLSGRIARPLRQLGKDASTLAAGDLSHRTAVRTHDEVGALADNFNRMAQSLERREEEARCSADELRQAKDTLTTVIDASPVAIVCSDLDRRIFLWSRSAEEIFGFPRRRGGRPALRHGAAEERRSAPASLRAGGPRVKRCGMCG